MLHHQSKPTALPGTVFVILSALLGILLLAGGGSRLDLMGQIIVRGAAWGLMIVAILFTVRRPQMGTYPIWLILIVALALVLLQSIPLPPGAWQMLPGRSALTAAAALSSEPQPWRPLAIVPRAAINAAFSLAVPIAVMFLASNLAETDRNRLPGLILTLVLAQMLLGLLQFSGAGFTSPLVNATPGEVSGTFANRNHFALFLAIGCLIAPAWAVVGTRRITWRLPTALGLVLLFELVILASGSRAGLVLGGLALVIALCLVRQGIKGVFASSKRWIFPAFAAGVASIFSVFVLVSVMANRAVSINRAFALDTGQDMRTRGLPVVSDMIAFYLPLGSGAGGFEPLFRSHETFGLLKGTYFNHAHNDALEIVLDFGLPGAALLAGAVIWSAWAGIRTWRADKDGSMLLPRLGSAVLLLVVLASVVDYPARTPLMMAMIVIAGVWLSRGAPVHRTSALPQPSQRL